MEAGKYSKYHHDIGSNHGRLDSTSNNVYETKNRGGKSRSWSKDKSLLPRARINGHGRLKGTSVEIDRNRNRDSSSYNPNKLILAAGFFRRNARSEGAAEGGVGGIPPRPSVPPERSGGGQFLSKKVRAKCIITAPNTL